MPNCSGNSSLHPWQATIAFSVSPAEEQASTSSEYNFETKAPTSSGGKLNCERPPHKSRWHSSAASCHLPHLTLSSRPRQATSTACPKVGNGVVPTITAGLAEEWFARPLPKPL